MLRVKGYRSLLLAMAILLTVANLILPQASFAEEKLEALRTMTPEDMVMRSPLILKLWNELLLFADKIGDPKLKTAVVDTLNNPAPTFLELYASSEAQEKTRAKLVEVGFLDPKVKTFELFPPAIPSIAPQPYYTASGSGWGSHHAYPGGLAVHVDFNMKMAMDFIRNYEVAYKIAVDSDLVIAAVIFHDCMKPYIFQWRAPGDILSEIRIAGTGAHHIFMIAELLHRRMNPKLVVASASAHDLAAGSKVVAKYIQAGALIAGIDPVAYGLLKEEPDGTFDLVSPQPVESWINHFSDGDWPYSVAAAKTTIPLLEKIAKEDYGMSDADLKGSRFYAFRNYVFSQVTMIGLYETFVKGGMDAARKKVASLITK